MRAAAWAIAACVFAPAASAADRYAEFHVGTTRADSPVVIYDERTEGAYGIGAGVAFNRWFSTQLDWHTLGENSIHPACLPPAMCVLSIFPEHGYSLRALPRLPLTDSVTIELGIGVMRWEGDVTYYGSVFDNSGTDPWYSLGVEWRFAERWSATIEYQQLEFDYDFDWTGATLRYRF